MIKKYFVCMVAGFLSVFGMGSTVFAEQAPDFWKKDYPAFKEVLKDLNKKSLEVFIKNHPDNYFLPYAKNNLKAIKNANGGFGKFTIVLSNNTKLSVIEVAKESISFGGSFTGVTEYYPAFDTLQLIAVAPDTVDHFQYSGTQELEPYLQILSGKKSVLLWDSNGIVLTSVKEQDATLISSHADKITKYKTEPEFVIKKPSFSAAAINVLKKYSLITSLNHQSFNKLPSDAQASLCRPLAEAPENWGVVKEWTETKVCNRLKNDGDGTIAAAALPSLNAYLTLGFNDIMVPSIQGKALYYPFVIFY